MSGWAPSEALPVGLRRMLRSALTGAVLTPLLALATAGAAPAAAGTPAPAGHINWTQCPKAAGYLCGSLRVPLDYQHPSRGTVSLAVIEHPAPESKGVIVFNPGGPGESGVLILPVLKLFLPAAVLQRFTLVSFDERGTGASDQLLCGPSPTAAVSAVPGTSAATRTFAGVERSCRSGYPKLFPTVNTTTSARDMNQLRIALGVSRINYYGLSYGSVLGTVYSELFPAHIRAMIVDGAVDANLNLAQQATEEAPAIQATLEHDLTACTATPNCPLGSDPLALYRRLVQRLASEPLPAPGGGDTTPVTAGDLASATLLYLSVPGLTPGYLAALAAAAAGNGAQLRSVAVGLDTDLNGSSLVGPLWAITCNDAADHPDGRAAAALARTLAARYPLGGAEAVANNLIGCAGWAGSKGNVAHVAADGAPTALVVGNTGDPNVPYAEDRQLASAIAGRLVTYVGYGHTWLLNGSSNPCMQGIVTAYLVNDVLPAKGTRCQG